MPLVPPDRRAIFAQRTDANMDAPTMADPTLIVCIAALGIAGGALGGARWAVHRGFAAPRVEEQGNPGDLDLCFDAVRVPTVGGRTLFGWHLPGDGSGAAVAAIHGWGANAETILPLVAPLVRAGYAVLVVDARNHGRSDADTFSSMPRFAEDLEHAVDWLAARPGVDRTRIAVLGHSIGGAAALLAASRRADIAAVVSLSAFDHPETVMRAWLERMGVSYRPLGWLVSRYVERVIGHRFDAIAPVATVSRLRCPVLIGHGAADDTVAPEAARAIHARRTSDRVELAILDGVGHDHVPCFDALGAALVAFLDRALAAPGPAGQGQGQC